VVEKSLTVRNVRAFTVQGVLYFVGIAFFDTSTVLPLFLRTLSSNLALVGAAVALRSFATLAVQVLFGMAVVKVRHVPRYLSGLLFAGYSAPLLVAAGLLAGMRGSTAVVLLFAALAVQWICDGFVSIGYYDLMGRTLGPSDRGRAMGAMQFVGGAGAVGAALVIKLILDLEHVDPIVRYTSLFLCGGVVLFLSALSFATTRDLPHRVPQADYRPLRHLREIPGLLRTRPVFVQALVCQAFMTLAMTVSPFVLLIARDQYHLADSLVTLLLGLQIAGSVLGGILVMYVSPRYGNHRSVQLFTLLLVLGIAAGLCAAAGFIPPFPSLVLLALSAGIGAASWAGFMGYFVDVAEKSRIPLYMSCNSLIMLPLAGAGLLGGVAAERFGFPVLLVVCLVFAVAALGLSLRLPSRDLHMEE
jgi:MFS family permease